MERPRKLVQIQRALRPAPASLQRGQTMFMMLIIVLLGLGFLVYSTLGNRSAKLDRQIKTDAALAMARDALLGRALSDSNRPGSFPCPDINDDGQLTLGVDFGALGACTRNIGRLPWRTLELPDLRDGDGEHLWYALSPAFADTTTNAINTNSIGSLIVYSSSTSSVLSNRAVAVVFSPGAPLGNQARSPTQTGPCAATGTTIAQSLCANNYLELEPGSGVNNANGTGPYIRAAANTVFNDRLLVVSDSVDLMTPIESRAAQAILTALQDYKAGSTGFCTCYPWADISDGFANDGLENGRVPLKGASTGHNNDWANAGVTIPQWLIDNQWWLVFFYTVASSKTYDHNAGSLTVDGITGKDVVLISTGAATNIRPVFPDDYIEDANNKDGGSAFITPTDTASKNRDRLYVLP